MSEQKQYICCQCGESIKDEEVWGICKQQGDIVFDNSGDLARQHSPCPKKEKSTKPNTATIEFGKPICGPNPEESPRQAMDRINPHFT